MALSAQQLTVSIAISLVLTCAVGTRVSGKGTSPMDYQTWVNKYAWKNRDHVATDLKAAQLKMVITVVEGEQQDAGDGLEGRSNVTVYISEVTDDGHMRGRSIDWFSEKGGGGERPMPTASLSRIDELLKSLSDDGSRLPPKGRRVLLQAVVGDHATTRVYDRADLPAEVYELARLGECYVRAYVPEFKPESEIDAHQHMSDGFLALSPDGRQLLTKGEHEDLQCWDPTTHELLAEIPKVGYRSISFSPQGYMVAVATYHGSEVFDAKTWKSVRELPQDTSSQFLPDGHLLVRNYRQPLRIYDVGTAKFVGPLSEVPAQAWEYHPGPKARRAVIQSQGRIISLWDIDLHRELAELRADADISAVAFSPDQSLVAVATMGTGRNDQEEYQIGIWRTETGQMVHALRPFERRASERTHGLLWSPDGTYVLAGTEGGMTGVSIFNAKSGRHRGQFSGCSRINGIVLLRDASQLVAGCNDGKIHFWDFLAAMTQIREFENSLTAHSTEGAR